jgi:proteasome alpha subunit
MPFYVSPEQAMKDKADYARKNIARGRDVVVIAYDGGILFVAPNPSRALHKISEIYDRIAFAAVGKYNEFENLRSAGVRYADVNGYMYDRSDVTARGLANFYAQNLGTIFTEAAKPFEVELVVAEVGAGAEDNQIYRITFDGSVVDEHGYVAMGGQADHVATVLQNRYSDGMPLAEALEVALAALGHSNGDDHTFTAGELEVAVLDRARDGRKFRRLIGSRLDDLLPAAPEPTETPEETEETEETATPAEEPSESSDADAEGQAAAEDANLDLPEPPSGGEGSEES